MYKAIIFDLDGVLIDTEGVHISAMQKAFQDEGHILTQNEIQGIVARSPVEYLPHMFTKLNWDHDKIPQFLELFRSYFNPVWDAEVALKPGVTEVLHDLKQKNVQLSLATNSSIKRARRFIEKFELEDVFTFVTGGDEVSKRKPDPEIYNVAKGKTGFSESDILVVEDSGVGLLAAKAANLKVVVIPNEYTKDHDFSAADYKVDSISEILNIN